jgi:hypothetical protein
MVSRQVKDRGSERPPQDGTIMPQRLWARREADAFIYNTP